MSINFVGFVLLAALGRADESEHRVAEFDLEKVQASYIVSLPDGFDQQQTWPLILDFHGAISASRKGANVTRDRLWSKFVNKAPYIVVGLNGRTRAWNMTRGERNDVAYARQVLDVVRKKSSIDPKRIYLAGFSSGSDNSQGPNARRPKPKPADTVLLGGKILTVDRHNRIAEALAIQNGRVLAVGSNTGIKKLTGPHTKVIRLNGSTVIPGIVAAHCHAVGVARNSLDRPHAELLSVAEVQDWIRRRAKQVPKGRWIRVPRTDITRLKERRHPTRAELDAACTTHPVIFTAARKHALNSLGFQRAGVTRAKSSVPGGEVILDEHGAPRLIAGAGGHFRKLIPRSVPSRDELLAALVNVHRHYNAVGITSIFERAGGIADFELYRELRAKGKLTVRMTQTFRSGFRSAESIERYTERVGVKTGDGDDWVRVGPLKIVVDGGIHWGNTYLREPYGKKRIKFYVHRDPQYRGDLNYSVDLMQQLFSAGHRLGRQWCCHVTGDAGVDSVLDALAAVHKQHPEIAKRRFTLTHAYFPAVDSIRRAAALGVCVDTQSSLYFKDSAAIAEIYGLRWAERFIGLGDWIRGGIPTAIAGDHMIGLDPDRAMNAYNPFLMLDVAVARKNREGVTFGPHQRVSRESALRCLTMSPAYLAFDENKKGSLEPGKFADLAVLDRDYLTCAEDKIRSIKVRMTMIEGRVVFDRRSNRQR